MPKKEFKLDLELRKQKHQDNFSNYENAVTLISSLESWFNFRWGPHGRVNPGLLDCFNRFPIVDGQTPDFEIKFHTPYVLWGDHKKTFQPIAKCRDDVEQVKRYATRRPPPIVVQPPPPTAATSDGANGEPEPAPVHPNYDVVILVSTENDDVAAAAIDTGRNELLGAPREEGVPPPFIAPVVVLGCHRDHESIKNEWYKLKWRNHHNNQRFSTPNVSPDLAVDDLNRLIVDAPFHPIPVDKSALNLTGRNPFINDAPPPLYTVIRLVVPALNALLSEDDRDQLQSTGKVDKTLTKADILGTKIVSDIAPRPNGLGNWIDTALEHMATDLLCARAVPDVDPKTYVITVDSVLLRSDPREMYGDRAATHAAKEAAKRGKRKGKGKRDKGGDTNQLRLF